MLCSCRAQCHRTSGGARRRQHLGEDEDRGAQGEGPCCMARTTVRAAGKPPAISRRLSPSLDQSRATSKRRPFDRDSACPPARSRTGVSTRIPFGDPAPKPCARGQDPCRQEQATPLGLGHDCRWTFHDFSGRLSGHSNLTWDTFSILPEAAVDDILVS